MRFADCVRGTLTLTDGAWGSELIRAGGQLTECLDGWNLTKPEQVRHVADSYIRSGSRAILTNTFRANPLTLCHYGLQDQCSAINRAGVRISRQAAANSAMVFASIGPIGKLGAKANASRSSLQLAFGQQARAIAAEVPDAIVIETMTDLDEAQIAAEAALSTGLPVVVSFVFISEKSDHRTPAGNTLRQVVAALDGAGVHAIGSNCCSLRDAASIGRQLADASLLPIWIKPNAGLPTLIDGSPTYNTTPEEFAASAQHLREVGVTFLGGCCGTTPDFIRVLANQPALGNTVSRVF